VPPAPSSPRVVFARPAAAPCAPPVVEPVNAILSTSGWPASALPTAGPNPVTTLKTPGGNPASSISAASSTAEAGEESEGLATMVHPAARAGASVQPSRHSRQHHRTL